MTKKEIRSEIKEVFAELYKILGMYEETDGYNAYPDDSQKDIMRDIGSMLLNAKAKADVLFLGEHEWCFAGSS